MPSTENQNISIEDFMKYVSEYLTPKQVAKVQKAYDLAARVHADQKRRSGEPYIIHPTQVAYILAQMKMDEETLCAAFLHDTVEDTDTTLDQLKELFGAKVAMLVDGVTKLGKSNTSPRKSGRLKITARCSWPWPRISAWLLSSWRTGCTTCAP